MNQKLKREHFQGKVKMAQEKIWDTEFVIAKARNERENFRMEYDRIRERIEQAEEKRDSLKEEKAKKKLNKLLTSLKQDYSQLEERMKSLDVWIDGPMIEPDDPSQQDRSLRFGLESLRSVLEMTKQYIKDI